MTKGKVLIFRRPQQAGVSQPIEEKIVVADPWDFGPIIKTIDSLLAEIADLSHKIKHPQDTD